MTVIRLPCIVGCDYSAAEAQDVQLALWGILVF